MDFRLILFGLTGALLSVACGQSHQYYFVNTSLNWTEAQSVCRRDYTDLATIESTADVDDFLSTSSNNTGKAWIGLYDDTINSWKWSLNDSSFYDSGEYSFRNWGPGQPDNNFGQQHCVRFCGSSYLPVGQWDDIGCTETMQFVCYNGTVGGSPSYVLSTFSLNWTEAQKFCRANYVDLASVRNQTENEIIRTLIGASNVWIGLYREKLWSDGSTSLFRNWADGEPNEPSGDQCVAGSFSDSGRWSDENCSLSLPFVCYKPIPPNAEGFTASAQDESSITLQWNKININTSFVLQFDGVETFISAPDGDGPVTHTVSSLTPGTNYTFTLFSVLDNVRSSGVSITAATASCTGCRCCASGTDCITTNGVVECLDPCDTYTVLNDTWRSTENRDNSILHCDQYISWSGWYRFYLGQTNAQIPEKCVPEQRCGTHAPLFITEAHPVQLNEIVTRTVCNAWYGSCCLFSSHTIQIKLCYGYYVYKLQRPSTCWLAYCTEPLPFRVLTQDETSITLMWNKMNNNFSFVLQFNGTETNISAPDGDGPVTYTVSSLTAGTRYTFTLFYVFGNVRNSGEQLTAVTAPRNAEGFMKSGQNESSITLQWNKINNSTNFVLQYDGRETNIRAPDGDGPVIHTVSFLTAGTRYTFTLFSVFENVRSSGVSITAFTGTDCITTNGVVQCLDPCDTYTVLNDTWRSTENTDYLMFNCDRYISWSGWYRFYLGQTSAQIPEKCVAENRCGTSVPLWINGTHPVQLNEIVTRNVFGSWWGSCFYFASNTIQIKLCYGYYVYKLQQPFGCNMAYCAEPQPFRVLTQDETSITLQWNKINNNISFVLQFNGTETNISAPDADGPVTYTVSSLTAGTEYTFTLFSVFGNVRNSGEQLTAVTAPRNAEGLTKSGQDESSITLQWNKINNSANFVLQYDGRETFIRAPDGDGPVIHTVSFLTAGTRYTFTLFSVIENVRSSGVSITAVTVPSNAQSFRPWSQDESSITLQWEKFNNIISFVLQFNGTETLIRAPDGYGLVTHTVSFLSAGTKYTFTLISVLENFTSSGISIAAATAPQNAEGLRPSDQDESSITLQWNKINDNTSFVLQFNGRETFIRAPDGDGPVTHTISSLAAGTRYSFSLFSVFENVRSSGVQLTAVTVPENAKGFRASEQDKSSITLRWNKVGSNINFVLQFNGTETFIGAPDGYGPVNYTVTSLTPRTNYTFTLFSVFENVRSSGVSIFEATGPNYVFGLDLKLELLEEMTKSEMEDALIELLRENNLPPHITLKIISSKP
ncbi:uncharacterized protein LOC116732421 [Xiphophorus hellerii]|uniref:uncharacterized protein LOC116732421 n=1 Tax=Xiphophorus hellerii TaxID=8084 RepID=UPI0013B3C449|nr:uncharacterized protein LOC116732421 [Xiphophorus hellerii]